MVGDQKIDFWAMLKKLKRLLPRTRFNYRMPKILEESGGVHQDDRIIIDSKDRSRVALLAAQLALGVGDPCRNGCENHVIVLQ